MIVPTPDAGYGTVHFDDPSAFSIVDQKLVAGVNLYGPGSCGACGNPVTGTYSWGWDGKEFVRAGADQAGHPPDTDIPATDLSGEVHGFLRAVDVGKSQITIDKVDWFADAAAAQACQEDGVSTDLYIDGWCTTHYYRNLNPMTRDVAVSPDALIILLSTDSPSDLPQASERVKAPQSDDPWEINVETDL